MNKASAVFKGAIVFYFIIALEVLIMISPFAGFFYSAFNPFLLAVAKYPATRWLSVFFLPHMVVPPDALLKAVRVAGSVLFLGGLGVFLICAAQVYSNKLRRRGAALKGLYSVIRHPQYAGLAAAGAGLAILWPRVLVVVLWLAMALVYYALAKDEERRMLAEYPETYREYMAGTGMFLPARVERAIFPSGAAGRAAFFVLLCALALGGAFGLRAYTIRHLPLWSDGGSVAVLAIDPSDMPMLEHRMSTLLASPEISQRLVPGERYLAYFIPRDYIMQGLIADTGGDWRLYKQHHAMGMITDWILHPFAHLSGGHHMMHHGGPQAPEQGMGGQTVRRIIFLQIEGVASDDPYDLLSIGAQRTPRFMADVEVHEAEILEIRDLPSDTGWGSVPTPVF